MSDLNLMYNKQDIQLWIEDTQNSDFLTVIGTDGEEGDFYGIGPYFTCYILFEEGQANNLIKSMIDLFHRFNEIKNEPWTWFGDLTYEKMIQAEKFDLKNLEKNCLKRYDQEGYLTFNASTSIDSEYSSAVWGLDFSLSFRAEMSYSTFKVNFRNAWYKNNKENQKIWQDYVAHCLSVLKPMHAYSGFEIATAPMGHIGSYAYSILEKIASDHFYGLDIDHPFSMGYHNHNRADGYVDSSALGAGIKTPVWSFMLSPYWLDKLNKTIDDIYIYFKAFSEVTITKIEYPNFKIGLWIQLGELSLYPKENGLPPLIVYANKLIKPIRCDYLKLTIMDRWEGDDNPCFDYESSLAWMRRFDVDESETQVEEKKIRPNNLFIP